MHSCARNLFHSLGCTCKRQAISLTVHVDLQLISSHKQRPTSKILPQNPMWSHAFTLAFGTQHHKGWLWPANSLQTQPASLAWEALFQFLAATDSSYWFCRGVTTPVMRSCASRFTAKKWKMVPNQWSLSQESSLLSLLGDPVTSQYLSVYFKNQ